MEPTPRKTLRLKQTVNRSAVQPGKTPTLKLKPGSKNKQTTNKKTGMDSGGGGQHVKAVPLPDPEVPGFPRKEGPPSVPNHKGASLFNDQDSSITLVLDRGSFRYVWEGMEAKCLHDWRLLGGSSLAVESVVKRTLMALRLAGKDYTGTPATLKPRLRKKAV